MIIKYPDGHEETHTILTYCILRQDDMMTRKILNISKENIILENILNKKVTIKYPNGQEGIYTPLDYANKDSGAAKIFKEFTDSLNTIVIDHQETLLTTSIVNNTKITNILTDAELYKNTNENNEELDNAVVVYKSNKITQKNTTTLTEKSMQEINTSDITVKYQTQSCSKSRKENVANQKEESSIKVIQQTQVAIAGTALLIGSIISCTLKMYTIAVIGGIIGLACISFALYDVLKPNTKLEKVKNVEQLDESLASLRLTNNLPLVLN